MFVTGRFVTLIALGAVAVVGVTIARVPGALGPDAVAVAWWALAGWLALTLAVAGVDAGLAASPRQVSVRREIPPRVRLGEPVAVTLIIENLGNRRLRAVVRDGWQPSAGVIGANRAQLSIGHGERRRTVLQLLPTRRGDRTTEHITIRSAGPLGIAGRQATIVARGRVRVLPPFKSRVHLPSRLVRLREIEGRTPLMIRGQGTEFDSIREYVRGDDVRSIDWRVTARHPDPSVPQGTKLMVRTWRPERDRRIVIVIDTSRTAAVRIGDEPRLDTGFEAALLLAALADRAGDRVDILAWDRRVRAQVHGASGAELLAQTVDRLANVEPELIEPDWSTLPARVRAITSQHAFVVLLTAADSAASARGLLSVLPQLTQRNTVAVASVADPDEVDASRQRDSLAAVYRAAAAERTLLDQHRVGDAIKQLGATVVTGTPEALPPALADHYLALKAAGRL